MAVLNEHLPVFMCLCVLITGQQTSVTDPPFGRILEDHIQRKITKAIAEQNFDLIKQEITREVELQVEKRMKSISEAQLLRGICSQ